MSAGHTPGPWQIERTYQGPLDRFKGFPYSINGSNGFQPCLIFGDGRRNRGTSEANARLIAAAPELLKALKRAAFILDGYSPETDAQFKAAISKAEGKA